jgi:hypothetical protein
VLLAAHQKLTKNWWDARRRDFELYLSQFVIDEISRGEAPMAARRLHEVKDLPLLNADDEVMALADALLRSGLFPAKAAQDAAHLSIAAVHGIDFVLTWNCVHLANAEIADRVNVVIISHGWNPPRVCTPIELMGADT